MKPRPNQDAQDNEHAVDVLAWARKEEPKKPGSSKSTVGSSEGVRRLRAADRKMFQKRTPKSDLDCIVQELEDVRRASNGFLFEGVRLNAQLSLVTEKMRELRARERSLLAAIRELGEPTYSI